MIDLENVCFSYKGGKKNEDNLSGINLRIKAGECVVLTGESGCGKTTLTRILNGLCPNYYEGVLKGSFRLNGEIVFSSKAEETIDIYENYEKSVDEIGCIVGNVFQDPRSQFFALNTTDEIVLAMENRGFERLKMKERIEELDAIMEVRELLDRNLLKMSSGEKQKVAIAGACSADPQVLIMDEPSANLDEEGVKQLGRVLARLKDKGYTIILSEHRLSYLRNVIDRVIIMKHGKIDKEFSSKSLNTISDENMIEMGLRVLSEIPEFKNTGRRISDTPILRVEKLFVKRGDKTVINDFSAEFYRGQITAIVGRNGAGKTTLCKTITGEVHQQKGKVFIYGASIPARKRIKDCFFVGQDADYQLFAETVLQEVTLNTDKTPESEDVKEILERLGLWEYRKRHPASLSGGQKQRVLLAAAFIRNPAILVLDEPTSGLDGRHMRIISEDLRRAAERGMCILVITHDKEFINNVADEVLRLDLN